MDCTDYYQINRQVPSVAAVLFRPNFIKNESLFHESRLTVTLSYVTVPNTNPQFICSGHFLINCANLC